MTALSTTEVVDILTVMWEWRRCKREKSSAKWCRNVAKFHALKHDIMAISSTREPFINQRIQTRGEVIYSRTWMRFITYASRPSSKCWISYMIIYICHWDISQSVRRWHANVLICHQLLNRHPFDFYWLHIPVHEHWTRANFLEFPNEQLDLSGNEPSKQYMMAVHCDARSRSRSTRPPCQRGLGAIKALRKLMASWWAVQLD